MTIVLLSSASLVLSDADPAIAAANTTQFSQTIRLTTLGDIRAKVLPVGQEWVASEDDQPVLARQVRHFHLDAGMALQIRNDGADEVKVWSNRVAGTPQDLQSGTAPGAGGSDPDLADRVTAVETSVGTPKVPALVEGQSVAYPIEETAVTILGQEFVVPPAADAIQAAASLHTLILATGGMQHIEVFPGGIDRILIRRNDGDLDIANGAGLGLPDGYVPFGHATGIFQELDYLQLITQGLSNRVAEFEQLFLVDMPGRPSEASGGGAYDLTVDADLSAAAGGYVQFDSGADLVSYYFSSAVSGQAAALITSLNGNGFTAIATPFGIDISRADGASFNATSAGGGDAIVGIPNGTFVDNGIPAGPQPLSLRQTIQHILDNM